MPAFLMMRLLKSTSPLTTGSVVEPRSVPGPLARETVTLETLLVATLPKGSVRTTLVVGKKGWPAVTEVGGWRKERLEAAAGVTEKRLERVMKLSAASVAVRM